MNNFFFCHKVFKSRLLQMRHNAFTSGVIFFGSKVASRMILPVYIHCKCISWPDFFNGCTGNITPKMLDATDMLKSYLVTVSIRYKIFLRWEKAIHAGCSEITLLINPFPHTGTLWHICSRQLLPQCFQFYLKIIHSFIKIFFISAQRNPLWSSG